MTQEHPITPPPELVNQWRAMPEYADISKKLFSISITANKLQDIATQAARWGANQELEACCEWLVNEGHEYEHVALRDARRPKPPSFKEQALAALAEADGADYPVICTTLTASQHALIRRALEQLDD